jgi:hypothetical protein
MSYQFLLWHDVRTAYPRVRPIDVTVTNALFHYTRFGEWIFGGVTHDLVASGPVCCLLSH